MTVADTDRLVEQGQQAFDRGDRVEAETLFRAALDAGRHDVVVLHFLGFLARTRDALTEAGTYYAAALALQPADAQLHNNLAEVRRAEGRDAEAVALYRRAIALAPELPQIHANLGALLLALRRPDEALPILQHALAQDPSLATLRNDIAVSLAALGRFEEALVQYREALRLQPNNANARYLLALAELALGDFSNGWRRHEARWYAELGRDKRRVFARPSWLGEDDLAGRTILLHAEQGFGDSLQFLRYLPMVAARAGQVLVEVQPPLVPLLRNLPRIAGVFARGDTLPRFDTHCSLMSLPRAFRTEIATIPRTVPYLHAAPDRLETWQRILGPRGERRRIAIAWSGSIGGPWNRDLPLHLLIPLLQRADCEFHVAQTDISDTDRATLTALSPRPVDHSTRLVDFADTAALLSCMDLVVSVDTALAHLAGALARPVWLMLPFGADYRWMTGRSDSPWYPTMKLFRQPGLDDWSHLLDAIDRAMSASAAVTAQ